MRFFISRSNMPNKKRNKNSMSLDAETEELARSVRELFIFDEDNSNSVLPSKPTYSQIVSNTLSRPENNTLTNLSSRPDNNTCPGAYIEPQAVVCDVRRPPPPYNPVLNYQSTLPVVHDFTKPPPVCYNSGPPVNNFPYTNHQPVIPHGTNTCLLYTSPSPRD